MNKKENTKLFLQAFQVMGGEFRVFQMHVDTR